MSSSPAASAAQRSDNSGGGGRYGGDMAEIWRRYGNPSASPNPHAGGFRCCCLVMPPDAGYCVRANSIPTYTQLHTPPTARVCPNSFPTEP